MLDALDLGAMAYAQQHAAQNPKIEDKIVLSPTSAVVEISASQWGDVSTLNPGDRRIVHVQADGQGTASFAEYGTMVPVQPGDCQAIAHQVRQTHP